MCYACIATFNEHEVISETTHEHNIRNTGLKYKELKTGNRYVSNNKP